MSNYQDRPLIEYVPNVLKSVREYQALMTAEQPEIFGLFAEIQTALDNQFIATAGEYGVKRWEKILGLIPKGNLTLDERKFTILARLNEKLPFTFLILKQMLEQLCGADRVFINLQHEIYTLNVLVALEARNNYNDVQALLKRIVPANLIVNLTLIYNIWERVKPHTWEQLTAKTWGAIREENESE